MNIIKIENQLYFSALELYKELGIKKKFATWIKQNIERAYLESDKDFVPYREQSTGGRPLDNYMLKKDSAIEIIILSGGEKAKDLRKKVIELYNAHDTGKAFTTEQINALIDLAKAMTLISFQKEYEKKHYAIYNQSEPWYNYRAALLGYSKESLIQAMTKINKNYSNQRAALLKLDANELIRTGVIDLMKSLGKTDEYAVNVGNLCKVFAEKMKLGNIIWNDIEENPLKINQSEVNERKQLFCNSIKQLK